MPNNMAMNCDLQKRMVQKSKRKALSYGFNGQTYVFCKVAKYICIIYVYAKMRVICDV